MSHFRRFLLLAGWASVILLAGPAVGDPQRAPRPPVCGAAHAATITRDDWGIAHVHGRTDADAVYGMIYAQAEDDFNRVEMNYLASLGRLAEAEGESALYEDLRTRLVMDPADLVQRYRAAPGWLQRLMVAWADGLNCYLASHPATHPRVLTRFEPWMALSFSEGSIGGDIERVPLAPLRALYGRAGEATPVAMTDVHVPREPGGSNGIAIAPANTRDHRALLLINPHTTFFFRSELQVTSDEGLNAYGAATWGQFFIYQGFNERLGWMHTSSGVDAVDFFRETIVRKGDHIYYRYGTGLRPVVATRVSLAYRTADGARATRDFTVYRTHHGPIVSADADGHWIAVAMMFRPTEALMQSYLQTKARDLSTYLTAVSLQANSSNNTVLADADGDIAYLHAQFVPRRADRFDYAHPVDGSDPATDWQGLHPLAELPQAINPPNGWVMNTNNWPYSAAGEFSPRQADFPRYMDRFGENPRGLHASALLAGRHDLTLDELNRLAYDPYLPAFATLLPGLIDAYEALAPTDPVRARLADPIATLRAWDDRWSVHSVATTLAALWGDEAWDRARPSAEAAGITVYAGIDRLLTPRQKLEILGEITDRLQHDFGTWRVPWGQMNRYQRTSGALHPAFSDEAPSIPVGFTASRWGSLASFAARRYPGTNRYYGNTGNSFVAVVEFGPRVRARAVSTGGASGDPGSIHFADQAARYADGALRPVYFYPDELAGHAERTYSPD